MKKILPIIAGVVLFAASCGGTVTATAGKKYTPTKETKQEEIKMGVTSVSTMPSVFRTAKIAGVDHAERFNRKMKMFADELAANLKGYEAKNTRVAVTTFVPVGKYETSEIFGRLSAQQMTIWLAAKGFKVEEIRKTPGILVKDKKGFFALSDRLENITDNLQIDLILVGTYAMVEGELLINSFFVRSGTREIVSTSTGVINVSNNTFLRPLVEPLSSSAVSDKRDFIAMREPLSEKESSSSKRMALKIEKLSRDIVNNLKKNVGKKVIISTYVDIDRFYSTNAFGRFVGEKLMEEMSLRGFAVIEIRAAKELMIQPNIGEMALSRDVNEMMGKYQADIMVLGTYKRAGDVVVVHTRLIVADNQEVISVASMELPVKEDDKFMQAMFQKKLDRVGFSRGIGGFPNE